jgi:hypothetical protein
MTTPARPDELFPSGQEPLPTPGIAHHKPAPAARFHAPAYVAQPLQGASSVTRTESTPAERVFRADKPAAPPAPPALVSTTPTPVPQAPQIDIAKLDTVLWQRFEKRLRIEQERRGRG